MKAIVTGGAGFIGSALVRHLVGESGWDVLVIDKLTYGANLASLAPVSDRPNYEFRQADICDAAAIADAFETFQPNLVFHLAAESHVDRSITGSAPFIQTNVVGTHILLEAAKTYWGRLEGEASEAFRFLHISTDEVFGSLGADGVFNEDSPYDPSSPYSSSKAASDHLVRAWHRTYGFPAMISNCSNNYGPYQFPEKLIPLMILNGLHGKDLPVYGDGQQVRDWLHVEDHVSALLAMASRGRIGETYCIGGRAERANIQIVEAICGALDKAQPASAPHIDQKRHVADRPGHDRRYAVDPSKIERELGWSQSHTFENGLQDTIDWYLANEDWWRPIREKVYAGERLGLTG